MLELSAPFQSKTLPYSVELSSRKNVGRSLMTLRATFCRGSVVENVVWDTLEAVAMPKHAFSLHHDSCGFGVGWHFK